MHDTCEEDGQSEILEYSKDFPCPVCCDDVDEDACCDHCGLYGKAYEFIPLR